MSNVSRFYDLRGDVVLAGAENVYEERRDSWVSRAPIVFLENQIPSAKGPEPRFLDLCCGTGVFSITPAKRGFRVVGIDVSPRSIEAAVWLAKLNDVADSSEFYVADAYEFLANGQERFQVIQILGSLYYLNFERIMPLIKSRLEPGGAFICLETNGDNGVVSFYRRLKSHFTGYRDEQTLKYLLRRHHFEWIAGQFATSERVYFDFLTLFFSWMPKHSKVARFVHTVLSRIDDVLLNKMRLNWLAFKVMTIGINT